MSCPFFQSTSEDDDDLSQRGKNEMSENLACRYDNYLGFVLLYFGDKLHENLSKCLKVLKNEKLSKLLTAQHPLSGQGGLTPIHDEHLFIITHQAFELWFKQILHEIDSARHIFDKQCMEERNMLMVISRMNRVAEILKLVSSQFCILETMTPQDFLDFRIYLEGGSGFQSCQFRLIEIRLGVREFTHCTAESEGKAHNSCKELRVNYNKQHYLRVFLDDEKAKLMKALSEPSLFALVNDWLERTPGLEEEGFDFFGKFKHSVQAMLKGDDAFAKDIEDPRQRKKRLEEIAQSVNTFNSIFDKERHDALVQKGERRFSHRATQGALMIYLYRDEPRLHLPFQFLQCLMDIDANMTKLRYGHTCMVQRMIGNKIGTGGSSGYLYLRSTCSDRYKVFLDLMNLSSFLVPRDRIPPLDAKIKQSLASHDWQADFGWKPSHSSTDKDSGIASTVVRALRRVSLSTQSSVEDKISAYRCESVKTESTI